MFGSKRTGTAKRRKPDHDLVLLRTVHGRGGEQIVRHVCDDRVTCVAPVEGRLHRGDVGELRLGEVVHGVGVGLDVVGVVSPRPAVKHLESAGWFSSVRRKMGKRT